MASNGTKLWYCSTCKKIVDTVLVDGYSFGDRLLEGVMFVVKNVKGKPRCTGVVDDDKDYLEELNGPMWIKECTKYCKENPASMVDAKCPTCETEVLINDIPPRKSYNIGEMNAANSLIYAHYSKTHLNLIKYLDGDTILDLAARIRAKEEIDIDAYLAPMLPELQKMADESAKIIAMQKKLEKQSRLR